MKLAEICNWLFLFITVLIKSIYSERQKSLAACIIRTGFLRLLKTVKQGAFSGIIFKSAGLSKL